MPAGNRTATPSTSSPQSIHFTDWTVAGLWFNVVPNFTINSSLTQTTYNQQHTVAVDSRLHGRERGGFRVWVVPADAQFMPTFRRPSPFCLVFFKVLWTTSWYSYSGTYILDAEELHEKAVLFLCIETCGVRKWGNTKKNGGVGYVTSTCCMAWCVSEKYQF